MLKELTLFGEIDKVKIAIDRIKEFDPSKIDPNKHYILPFSGGKDSLACCILAKKAGIKFIAIKAPTPARQNYSNMYIRILRYARHEKKR